MFAGRARAVNRHCSNPESSQRLSKMEDFLEDTGKKTYLKKQEIFKNGYQNIVVSNASQRPDFWKVVFLAVYFIFSFLINDIYAIAAAVPDLVSI